MGTPLPEESGPCPSPNTCWTGGDFPSPAVTPEFLRVSVAGIIRGDLWNPFELDPPNGGYVVQQISGVQWVGNNGIYNVTIILNPTNSQFSVTKFSPLPQFMFNAFGGRCPKSLPNEQVEPTTNKYILGTVTILGI